MSLFFGRIFARLKVFQVFRSTFDFFHSKLARSHQAEIVAIKRVIQGRYNVTRVRVDLELTAGYSTRNIVKTFFPARTHCTVAGP